MLPSSRDKNLLSVANTATLIVIFDSRVLAILGRTGCPTADTISVFLRPFGGPSICLPSPIFSDFGTATSNARGQLLPLAALFLWINEAVLDRAGKVTTIDFRSGRSSDGIMSRTQRVKDIISEHVVIVRRPADNQIVVSDLSATFLGIARILLNSSHKETPLVPATFVHVGLQQMLYETCTCAGVVSITSDK